MRKIIVLCFILGIAGLLVTAFFQKYVYLTLFISATFWGIGAMILQKKLKARWRNEIDSTPPRDAYSTYVDRDCDWHPDNEQMF